MKRRRIRSRIASSFPFASVVKISQDQIPSALGPSLVVTAITNDSNLIQKLVNSPNVDRLNVGACRQIKSAGINRMKEISLSTIRAAGFSTRRLRFKVFR